MLWEALNRFFGVNEKTQVPQTTFSPGTKALHKSRVQFCSLYLFTICNVWLYSDEYHTYNLGQIPFRWLPSLQVGMSRKLGRCSLTLILGIQDIFGIMTYRVTRTGRFVPFYSINWHFLTLFGYFS